MSEAAMIPTQSEQPNNAAQRPAATLRIAVGIPTAGRASVLNQMLARLVKQSRPADAIIVCASSPDDVVGIAERYPFVTLISGPRGASHQRNAILRQLDGFDVVVFFDDDFLPCPDYIRAVERLMLAHPDVVITTGRVLRDGIGGPGLTFEEAEALLQSDVLPDSVDELQDVSNGYGCNMSVRLAPQRANTIYFDERLPLYSWLEDVDFSHRLGQFGRVVKSPATRGVHLGVKSGRQTGKRLGYSQVANPIYLARKGTCSWSRSLSLIGRNLTANVVFSLRPEPWVDRRGRLAGNLLAIFDLIRVRLEPDRVLVL